MKILIAPSIFASDLTHLYDEVKRTEASGADVVHFDIMDGVYVPNISIGFEVLAAVRKITDLPIDAHMMTVRPEAYFERLNELGADIVTIHTDIADEEKTKVMLNDIRSYGMMAGLAVKPAQPAEAALPYLDCIDMLLVMTVEPGFSGQSFMDMSEKIRALRGYLGERDVSIQVDGGINPETAAKCAAAGASVFVCGSAAYRSENMGETLGAIRRSAQTAYSK